MKLTKSICAFALFAPLVLADTTVLFAPNSPATGPFPSNALTLNTNSEKTGVQLNLPTSSCSTGLPLPSSCTNALLLNQLDGFSVNPQIVVCFSGAVNIGTLAGGIQITPIKSGTPVGINQVLYDPTSNCMYAKPDQVLAQQTDYLLTVASSVLDASAKAVKADPQFTACLNGGSAYCTSLSTAVSQNPVKSGLVAASLFTTMSATDWLEKAQTFVNQPSTPVQTLPAGAQSQFTMSDVSSLTWTPDLGPGQPTTAQTIPLTALSGVDSVAFGLYLSPNFINVSGPLAGTISVTPTGMPISGPVPVGATAASAFVPVSYHVFLPPARLMPPGGFPVVIYGHGLGDNQFGASTFIASTFASAGIATLCIEIPGHGFGPHGVVQVGIKKGHKSALVATPGRGIQLDPKAPIASNAGCIGPGPIGVRDCARQTAVDLFALVRTIRATNGLNLGLNDSRIYYVGQSFGGIYGTLFHAVEPAIKAAILNVGGGSSVAVSRLTPLGRQLAAYYLGTSNPPLLNAIPYGPAPSQDYFHDAFNDNYVYRDMAPVMNYPAPAGPSVIAVDNALEIADWLNMNGDPLAFAFKLKNQQVPGMIGKSTLIQFALGDLEVPNPTNSALIRAAGLQSSSWLFRFDIAAAQAKELLSVSFASDTHYPALPHAFLSNPTLFTGIAAEDSIALAAQRQAAAYFAVGGIFIPNPNWFLTGEFAGKTLFEIPTKLPEQLNFNPLQIPK